MGPDCVQFLAEGFWSFRGSVWFLFPYMTFLNEMKSSEVIFWEDENILNLPSYQISLYLWNFFIRNWCFGLNSSDPCYISFQCFFVVVVVVKV